MSAWTPAEITTALWIDPLDSTSITTDSSDQITAITDKSSEAHVLTVEGTPDLVSSGISFIDEEGFYVPGLLRTTPITVTFALKTSSTVFSLMGLYGQYPLLWVESESSSSPFRYSLTGEPTASYINGSLTDLSTEIIAYNAISTGGTIILSFVLDSFADGVDPRAKTTFGGTLDYPAMGYDGIIGEIIIHDEAYREKVEGYLAWKHGIESILPTTHPYSAAAPVTVSLSSLIFTQPFGIRLDAMLEQPLTLLSMWGISLSQSFGIRLAAVLSQPLGDCAKVQATLDQYLSDCPALRTVLKQAISYTESVQHNFNQPVTMLDVLRMTLGQSLSIADEPMRQALTQRFSIQELEQFKMAFSQLFAIDPGGIVPQEGTTTVTVDGQEVLPSAIQQVFLEQDETVFHCVGELQILTSTVALLFKTGISVVEITIPDGTVFILTPEAGRRTATNGEETWIIPLVSPTISLDFPTASALEAPEEGALSTAVAATLAGSHEITWDLPAWYLSADMLSYMEDASPIDALKTLAAAPAGLIQTTPGGVLLARPEYPISTTDIETATPDYTLVDNNDIFTVDVAADDRDGYNSYTYTTSSSDDDSESVSLEGEQISSTLARVKVWTPLELGCNLLHSGGSWVTITDEGITEETISEQVEIIEGVGTLQYACTEIVSIDYDEDDLGALTVSGTSITTATALNTLIDLEYTTRYYMFYVNDPQAEDVQVYPEYPLTEATESTTGISTSTTLSRQPADKPGDDITDDLLEGAPAAIKARLIGELDYNCSQRQTVSTTSPDIGYIATGSLLEIEESGGTWRGICRYWSYTETITEHDYSITVALGIEKEAE